MLVLTDHVACRRTIHSLYTEILDGLPGVKVKQNPSGEYDSDSWLTCITVDPDMYIYNVMADELRPYPEGGNIGSRLLCRPFLFVLSTHLLISPL